MSSSFGIKVSRRLCAENRQCVCVYTWDCIYSFVCVCVCTYIYPFGIEVSRRLCAENRQCVCVYIYICLYKFMCVCVCVCIYLFLCNHSVEATLRWEPTMYVYIYLLVYIHACVWVYIYIHSCGIEMSRQSYTANRQCVSEYISICICECVQPNADRVALHLEIISKTFPTHQNSAHGIYD